MENPETWGLPASTWDVIGTLLTAGALLAAAIAAVVAVLQHRAAGGARLDQARPYVVLSAVESPVDRSFIDLQLANVGNGPAYDVRIKVTPPFVTSTDEAGYEIRNARIFTETIPMLAPHYTISMFFDSAIERLGKDLPDRFEARISYRDASGHHWDDELNVIDLSIQKGLTYTAVYGVHHVAKALREMQKDTKKLASKGLAVEATIETRDERAARWTQEREANRERRRRYEEQQRAEQGDGQV